MSSIPEYLTRYATPQWLAQVSLVEYPLKHEDLAAGSSRGVSNVMTHPMATVQLESGTLVAVQPGRK